MKKEFNVIGLDCGHCALTLEKYIQSVKGVKNCMVNFSTSKIFVEIEDEISRQVLKDIYKISKQAFPNIKLYEGKSEDTSVNIVAIILYSIGLMLGLFVLLANMNIYLYYTMLIVSGLLMGYNTYYLTFKQLFMGKLNENTLVTISIIGAIAVGESLEGLMVIALYTFGKMLESRAVNYSRKSIAGLIDSQPEFAVVLDGEKEKKVKPEDVHVGEIIIVRPGEKIALDGIIIEGVANIDKQHLTGESLPINVTKGIEVESGSIVLDSILKIQVTREYKEGTVSKILELVSNATNKKSKTESFISKFSSWYTIGVLILSVLVSSITMLILKDWNIAIYRGLIFLVVSCPCAFAISVPLTYFSGIGRCSKQGILVKGSIYLDVCAKLKQIIFDKTGTLTTGTFKVEKIEIVDKELTEKKLLEIVVAGEQNSLHPIAIAICNYYGKKSKLKISNFKELAGYGVQFEVDGDVYKIGRTETKAVNTCIDIDKNNNIIAKILLKDAIKENVKFAIDQLKEKNVDVTMLTGDNKYVAGSVAKELGIDNYHAEMYPNDKFDFIEKAKEVNSIAFVGDGINDAPALALADIGISMGLMGCKSTIEASDIVIADDNILKIPELIDVSKYTKKIVMQNIIFAGVTKLTFLLLGALGISGMLLAVFADVGVTLIAILNSLRVLKHKNKI